ncbi:3' exoribonuclease family protein [Apiospora arundinis]
MLPRRPHAPTDASPPRLAPPYINTSSLSHAHGSAVVRNGDTTVICGVRGETILTSAIPNYRASSAVDDSSSALDEARDYDLLVPNIELATGCAPNFLPGVPPTTLAQTLSTRVYSLLHSSKLVDVNRLRIYPEEVGGEKNKEDDEKMDEAEEVDEYAVSEDKAVKAYWVLYIDVLFISFDGNPFDTAWTAILAALRDTKLPQAYWDADREMVLCKRSPAKMSSLDLRGLPVACTAAVFTAKEKQKKGNGSYWVLVDPDRLEEGLCDETVTVVVDQLSGSTKILGISKHGGTVVGPELMKKMVAAAESRWEQIRAAME